MNQRNDPRDTPDPRDLSALRERLDDLERDLRLTAAQTARLLGITNPAAHLAWRLGGPRPLPPDALADRVAALEALAAELFSTFRTPEIALAWFWDRRPPSLDGATPAETALGGGLKRVTRILCDVKCGAWA